MAWAAGGRGAGGRRVSVIGIVDGGVWHKNYETLSLIDFIKLFCIYFVRIAFVSLSGSSGFGTPLCLIYFANALLWDSSRVFFMGRISVLFYALTISLRAVDGEMGFHFVAICIFL